ncbi:MAG: type II toxin-antitoxin system HicA family toxin [Treponemataceae bacterium]|nr:type II toxin-antitoxin system HicA family toxin [Treponemataceae bacterium]
MTARNIIRLLKTDGWVEVRQIGSHKQFKHPVKQGLVTVPCHSKDIAIGTLNSILNQAGLK